MRVGFMGPPLRRCRGHRGAITGDETRSGSRVELGGSVTPVLRTAFDVSSYTREARGKADVDVDAIIGAATASTGPTARQLAELRRDLDFLHQLESSALTETRTMYSAWTVNEARITAFIATWLWERHWWADALHQLAHALAAADRQRDGALRTVSTPRPPRPAAALRRVYVQRALPVVGAGWTWLAGEKVTAGHMARMAIQEGSLQAAVRALLPRTAMLPEMHRVLTELIERRSRTLSFFRLEAIARITRSPGEAIVARLVLTVGGDPMRPAGQSVGDESTALTSIFRRPADRAALRAARYEITRLLPGPDLHCDLSAATTHRTITSPASPRNGSPRGF